MRSDSVVNVFKSLLDKVAVVIVLMEDYKFIVDEKGNYIVQDNKILVQNSSNDLVYVPYEEKTLPQEKENNFEVQERSAERISWQREDILKLIALYKKYESKFKSTTVKNDKVWSQIAEELKSHSTEQVKNKFKYLKHKYVEKKDNMKTTSSGARCVNFQYFEEFEEIFGGDPNISPTNIASSLKGNVPSCSSKSTSDIESEDSNCSAITPAVSGKKRSSSQLQKQLYSFHEHLEEKEKCKQARHEERMKRQDEALDILRSIKDSFDKIKDK